MSPAAVVGLLALLASTACLATNPNLPGHGESTSSESTGSSSGSTIGTSTSATSPAESSTSTPTGTADATTSDTGDGCPMATHACVAPAPEGWTGPVGVIRDANRGEAPACAAPFEGDAVVAYGGLSAPPAECDCACEPIDVDCDFASLVIDDAAACGSPSEVDQLGLHLACQTVVGASIGYVGVEPPAIGQGSCAPAESQETPPATFDARRTACAATLLEADGCGATEVCAPLPSEPFAAELCIWSPGDVECPADLGYDVRELVHQDVDDSRGCSECQCGEAGGTCTGMVQLWSAAECGGSLITTIELGGACEEIDTTVVSASIVGLAGAGTCGPHTGAQPAGQAVATDPLTLCCRG